MSNPTKTTAKLFFGIFIWGAIFIAGMFATAVTCRVVWPQEKINAAWMLVAGACFFAIAYRFYASFLAAKVLALSKTQITPAFNMEDGIDYQPTNRWVLFGHHFAAIAGAGPLIGPMLAAQFGYLPGFLWILVGAVVAGGVHDMVILAISVHHNGRSLATIAKEELGPISYITTALAVIFIIIATLAGFGLAVVNSLHGNSWGTFIVATTIPIALFMGLYLYRIRWGKVTETTAIGVVALLCCVAIGHKIPHSFLGPVLALSRNELISAIAIYGFIASVLPVWLLLCPRDYLSTYIKIGTIMLLALSVIIARPHLEMPALTVFVNGGGPIIHGKLFPFMFITIACGAISGFHSTISTGTTPKMISSERDIRLIGYGAMLVEGFVALVALTAASMLIPGDYFAINSKLSFDTLAAMGFPVEHVEELSRLVETEIIGRTGGAVSLAVGMASMLSNLPGLKHLMPYWYNFALMFEALFVLTAIDTGTRVARFLVQELGGHLWKPLAVQRWLPGIIISSAVVVSAWSYLIVSGNISTIWPMFGVANQILASIALGIGTTVIIKSGRARYAWTTFVPMVFMVITTLTAAVKSIIMYQQEARTALVAQALVLNVDSLLVGLMAILAVIAITDMLIRWLRFFSSGESGPQT